MSGSLVSPPSEGCGASSDAPRVHSAGSSPALPSSWIERRTNESGDGASAFAAAGPSKLRSRCIIARREKASSTGPKPDDVSCCTQNSLFTTPLSETLSLARAMLRSRPDSTVDRCASSPGRSTRVRTCTTVHAPATSDSVRGASSTFTSRSDCASRCSSSSSCWRLLLDIDVGIIVESLRMSRSSSFWRNSSFCASSSLIELLAPRSRRKLARTYSHHAMPTVAAPAAAPARRALDDMRSPTSEVESSSSSAPEVCAF